MFVGSTEDQSKAALEKFSHIIEKLCVLWGHVGVDEYLDSLFLTDRPDRAGFPAEVMMEIMFLQRLHHEVLPPLAADIWEDAYKI